MRGRESSSQGDGATGIARRAGEYPPAEDDTDDRSFRRVMVEFTKGDERHLKSPRPRKRCTAESGISGRLFISYARAREQRQFNRGAFALKCCRDFH